MTNNSYDMMLEELGLSDCFVDAEEELEITPKQILDLRMKIDEATTRNQIMLNRGIELLTFPEKLDREKISEKELVKNLSIKRK